MGSCQCFLGKSVIRSKRRATRRRGSCRILGTAEAARRPSHLAPEEIGTRVDGGTGKYGVSGVFSNNEPMPVVREWKGRNCIQCPKLAVVLGGITPILDFQNHSK